MPPQDFIQLRLYVSGDSPRSQQAIRHLRRLDATDLAGRYDLEVVDVLERPELAEADRVMATPTLLRISPAPCRRILGDLGDLDRLLQALGPAGPDAVA
jgi:circadian clock protein KaiB